MKAVEAPRPFRFRRSALALDRAGVLHTGSFSSRAAQSRTLIVTVTGVKVAFLAYIEMTNGPPLGHRVSGITQCLSAGDRASADHRP
jgi:Bacterial capsule synthesis protein PGA_cap